MKKPRLTTGAGAAWRKEETRHPSVSTVSVKKFEPRLFENERQLNPRMREATLQHIVDSGSGVYKGRDRYCPQMMQRSDNTAIPFPFRRAGVITRTHSCWCSTPFSAFGHFFIVCPLQKRHISWRPHCDYDFDLRNLLLTVSAPNVRQALFRRAGVRHSEVNRKCSVPWESENQSAPSAL